VLDKGYIEFVASLAQIVHKGQDLCQRRGCLRIGGWEAWRAALKRLPNSWDINLAQRPAQIGKDFGSVSLPQHLFDKQPRRLLGFGVNRSFGGRLILSVAGRCKSSRECHEQRGQYRSQAHAVSPVI